MTKDEWLEVLDNKSHVVTFYDIDTILELRKIIIQHFSISEQEREETVEWTKKTLKGWEALKRKHPEFVFPEIYPHLRIYLKALGENK